ncbi:hypothetical protein RM530_03925 [Algiphilus sp. W345]|uniref:Uncharacterized protein n=1 Tax=Banduia mediterranea TaxID=3075609 RepID=A0ABU2WG73_9GAMM|nr:hypothetical protein [Algiphilus sp. W345]MDT0496513.1 hypothetical protein [Algiphilus sp. W345]
MLLEIDFWALLTFLVGLLVTFMGGAWGVIRMTQHQQDQTLTQRLHGIEGSLNKLETNARQEAEQWQRVDKEILKLRAELPLQYVRREDYVRGQTVIESKLDALATKLETVQLRGTP